MIAPPSVLMLLMRLGNISDSRNISVSVSTINNTNLHGEPTKVVLTFFNYVNIICQINANKTPDIFTV